MRKKREITTTTEGGQGKTMCGKNPIGPVFENGDPHVFQKTSGKKGGGRTRRKRQMTKRTSRGQFPQDRIGEKKRTN